MTIHGLRWLTLAVWAAVGASALFWGLRLFATGPAVPADATAVVAGPGLQGDPTRLLGAAAAPVAVAAADLPPAPSRFTLLGVVAPRAPAAAAEGLAVIAVDDDPPRAFRVGAVVDGDLVVRRVHARGVELGDAVGGPGFALDAPPLVPGAAPATRPVPAFQVPRMRPTVPVTPVMTRPTAMPEPVSEGDTPLPEEDLSSDVEPETPPSVTPGRPGLETR
jgi:general secretion pathway protein C